MCIPVLNGEAESCIDLVVECVCAENIDDDGEGTWMEGGGMHITSEDGTSATSAEFIRNMEASMYACFHFQGKCSLHHTLTH